MVISSSFIDISTQTYTGSQDIFTFEKIKCQWQFSGFARGFSVSLGPDHTTLTEPPGILPPYLFYFTPSV